MVSIFFFFLEYHIGILEGGKCKKEIQYHPQCVEMATVG